MQACQIVGAHPRSRKTWPELLYEACNLIFRNYLQFSTGMSPPSSGTQVAYLQHHLAGNPIASTINQTCEYFTISILSLASIDLSLAELHSPFVADSSE